MHSNLQKRFLGVLIISLLLALPLFLIESARKEFPLRLSDSIHLNVASSLSPPTKIKKTVPTALNAFDEAKMNTLHEILAKKMTMIRDWIASYEFCPLLSDESSRENS